MKTKSTFANRQVVPRSPRSTSRRAEFLDTLRGQMDDAARGERIKALREARKLTQPAVVDRMCEIGGRKPDGRPYIGLRGYQRYEEGGGIPWDKTRVLAQVFDTTEDFILRGDGERRQPRPARSIDADLAERLANIEERLDASEPVAVNRLDGELADRIATIEGTLAGLRTGQDRVSGLVQQAVDLVREARSVQDGFRETLQEQTSLLRDIRAATAHAHDAADRLDDAVERAATGLRSAPRAKRPAAPRTARKHSPRASKPGPA